MKQLDNANQKALTKAAVNNQPFHRAYVEYETVCPYCEQKLQMDGWPGYKCHCSEWMANFVGTYERRPLINGSKDTSI